MACNRAKNIKIRPHDAYFEERETFCIDFKDLVGADLANSAIVWNRTSTPRHFYFQVDSGPSQEIVETDFTGLAGGFFDQNEGFFVQFYNNASLYPASSDFFVWFQVTDGVNANLQPAAGQGTAYVAQITLASTDADIAQAYAAAVDTAILSGSHDFLLNVDLPSPELAIVSYVNGVAPDNTNYGTGPTTTVTSNGAAQNLSGYTLANPGDITDAITPALTASTSAEDIAQIFLDWWVDGDLTNKSYRDGTSVVIIRGNFLSVYADTSQTGNFPIVETVAKGGQVYLGLLDGDITLTPEITNLDITAHQTGATILSQIPQSLGATVELTIKECTKEIYEAMITAAGGTHTPSGGTELYGWGTDKLSNNILTYAKRLRLTPVGAADNSEDWVFWRTFPEIGGITFSGENPQLLPVTFRAFPDDTKPKEINIYAIGDWTQL